MIGGLGNPAASNLIQKNDLVAAAIGMIYMLTARGQAWSAARRSSKNGCGDYTSRLLRV